MIKHRSGPRALVSRAALPLVLVTLGALSSAAALAQEGGEELVARVDGRGITMAELEASVEAQLRQLEMQRHTLLEGALAGIVDKALLAREAEARGISLAELLATEVESKTPEVTDVDVDTWYAQNRDRVGNNPKEQIAPQIREFLQRQRGAGETTRLLDELRAKYEVQLLFEPLRHEFDLTSATWKGSESAPVTLVEFSDFQCPACRGFNPILGELLAEYPEKVRVAFLQSPLRNIHPQAQEAAEASLCARDQDKFWQYHDALFADQSKLAVAELKATANTLGLDMEEFEACLAEDRYAAQVQSDLDQAMKVGASGTPSVFINGRPITPGRVPSLDSLKAIVDDELLRLGQDDASSGS
ncbi:MAG: hypothetical protein DWQ36_16395 [Acidobacteria bacterium]|nr:MAG: hypothetical protein DWQ30_16465 [Acidobacteriota bacterium]REK05384.1 MAG: hypothetical protein DWQ36_16395 [Acidobacteriota bacterium]